MLKLKIWSSIKMKKQFFARATIAAALVLGTQTVNAALVFSDISLTSDSVTFTVNGDFSGYTPNASTDRTQISIRYTGDLWVGPRNTFSANTWSNTLFDGVSFAREGLSGMFYGNNQPYTWSSYDSDLTTAVATNRVVTLDLGANYLDPNATGAIEFVWGNGYNASLITPIETIIDPGLPVVSAAAAVSSPATFGLFSAGLACLGLVRRRA